VLRFTVSLSRSEQGGNELSAVLFALELVDFPVTGEGKRMAACHEERMLVREAQK
jgi:hypothetical protein